MGIGEWIAGAGAVLSIVALFLPWYSVAGHHVTGWQALAVNDVLIALAALTTIGALVLDSLPRSAGAAIAALALASGPAVLVAVLTVIRLLDPAPAGDASLAVGAWLALAGTLAMAIGLFAAMRDEGPERRDPAAEERAARAARERAELLTVPGASGPDDGAGRAT